MKRFRLAGAAMALTFLSCGSRIGTAQSVASAPSTDEVLTRLYAYANEFEAKLPSLSCHESIVIEDLKHGEVKKTTRIESTIRVVRTGDEKNPFTENHTFLTKDGVPAPEKFGISYWVTGVFAHALGFSHREATPCYDYKLEPLGDGGGFTFNLERHPGSDALQACRDWSLPGIQKVVVLDRDWHVLHVERTIPAEVAKRRREVSFAAMDYAPVTLGAETIWLPAKMQSHDPRDEHRLEVRYSECQRFTGSMKILDGVQPVREP